MEHYLVFQSSWQVHAIKWNGWIAKCTRKSCFAKKKSILKNYVVYNDEIESLVESFKDDLEKHISPNKLSRWLGLRIIDGDESLFFIF